MSGAAEDAVPEEQGKQRAQRALRKRQQLEPQRQQQVRKRGKHAPEAPSNSQKDAEVRQTAAAAPGEQAAAHQAAAAAAARPAAAAAAQPQPPAAADEVPQQAAAKEAEAAEAERIRLQLSDAFQLFQQQKKERQLFLELDVAARLGQRALIGRQVRPYWPEDDAWYLGTVTGYNEVTGEHTVHYADGDRESVIIALERVRLLLHAGEQLPPRDPIILHRYVSLLRSRAAEAKAARGKKQQQQQAVAAAAPGESQAAALLRRAAELEQIASTLPTEELEELAQFRAAKQTGTQVAPLLEPTTTILKALHLAAQLPPSAPLHSIVEPSQGPGNKATRSHGIRVHLKSSRTIPFGFSREQAIVGADLVQVWRQLIADGKVALAQATKQSLHLPTVGYRQDEELVAQLRRVETIAQMSAFLKTILLGAAGGQEEADELAAELEQEQQQAAAAAAEGEGQEEEEEQAAAEGEQQHGEQRVALGEQQQAQPASPAAPTPSGAEAAAAAAGAGTTDASCTAASGATVGAPAQQPVLRPGEVGWFKVSGFPHWPFMVVTKEEALAHGVAAIKFSNPSFLPVQFFGTGEFSAINPNAVDLKSGKKRQRCFAHLEEGLELGLHAPAKCNKRQYFRRALFELVTYLREGELPPCMLPRHNDGLSACDDAEEDGETPTKPAAKRRKGGKAAAAGAAGAGTWQPGQGLYVTQKLRVLCLGEVEWLHPAFHNEKYIFPPGYKAVRITATPASGREEVPHVMEVLRAPDGSGPLFRVTPQGCAPVEGPTASKAWQALYACDEEGRARTLGLSGDLMFGLSIEKVQRAIQALPGATRCDRYCGWREGEQPVVPPLSEREQRERLACEARMQRLPEGVAGVPVRNGAAGVCHVCNEEEEDEDDLIVQCNKCHVFVHMACYGVRQAPNGNLWLCDPCALGLQHPPPCALCPVVGGALKRSMCGRWAHPTCAHWLPETSLEPSASHLGLHGLVQGIQQVHRSRFQLTCQLCQQPHGACTQCCDPKCYAGYHPLCARQAGYAMELVVESDCESEEDESDEQQQQQAAGSCDENDAAAPNGSSRGGSQQRGSAGSKQRRRRKEGTVTGGIRLLSYCPKHGHKAVKAGTAAAAAAALPPLAPLGQQAGGARAAGKGSRQALAAPAASDRQLQQQPASRQQSAAGGGSGLALGLGPASAAASSANLQQLEQAPAAAAAAGAVAMAAAAVPQAPLAPPPNPWGSARAMPYSHASRRGARAPDAVAAAEAKRGFVRSVPYLVGGPLQQPLASLPASTCRRIPAAPPRPVQQQQQDNEEAPEQQQQAEQQQAGQQQQQQAAGEAAGQAGQQEAAAAEQQQQQADAGAMPLPAGAQPEAAPLAAELLPPPAQEQQQRAQQEQQPPADHHQQQQEQQPNSPAAGQARTLLSPSRNVKSDADRYLEMVATQGQRVTIGKSGIHGWGAFAKRRHSQFDMVIEYVGELVRPSVSDLRERRMYDAMVGAGTYVFRLNKDLCVDATRAGNLAHMLNHSCNPNCYSRTIGIKGPDGRVEDHVVIFALRDIEAWEELTYDYRFCGEEQLPCNCGAANCRGRVNKQVAGGGEEGLRVPRSALRPYLKQQR